MTFLPVVMRELRASARHPSSYWIRIGCGAVFALLFWVALASDKGTQAQQGARLFSSLNAALFLSILVVVPLLAADCISRERREGTLGLLFQTPLSAQGIVVGKVACHSFRALSLFLVALPVLAVSFLLGGTAWQDLAMAGLLDLTILVLGLSAALVASSFCRDWTRAILVALVFTVCVAFIAFALHSLATTWLGLSHPPRVRGRVWWPSDPWERTWNGFWNAPFLQRLESVLAHATGWFPYQRGNLPYSTSWQEWRRYTAPEFLELWLAWGVSFFLGSTLVLYGSIRLAAWRIRLAWQETPAPLWQQKTARTFTKPVFMRGSLQRGLAGMMNRNPIGWLQQRTWSARTIKWSWCLVVILFECAIMAEFQSNVFSQSWLVNGQYVVGALLLASMAFSAATSFREEVETGALELLLVTPLSPGQMILGRIRGIWGQFLPALLLLGLGWGWLAYDLRDFLGRNEDLDLKMWALYAPAAMLSCFLLAPGIGLYFSLRKLHFVTAWLMAGMFSILIPAAFAFMTHAWMHTTLAMHADRPGWYDPKLGSLVVFVHVQSALCVVSVWLLRRNLTQRIFVVGRA